MVGSQGDIITRDCRIFRVHCEMPALRGCRLLFSRDSHKVTGFTNLTRVCHHKGLSHASTPT
ncbi:hypothetical protein PAXRUDRAFT_413435 [Paxillus rubicundulus Ve08.2h10]|uniref:Uncharacterized protein n=1 Tax=Paxillus rubicundulus Ve08.2h10 TaxID=930991 RepID=A0A0D0DCQ9_9AGAM|nr:hypothetical protein PAXRUDRAFT_413435 [Paxillus rubicundulus Ve08.2h10]